MGAHLVLRRFRSQHHHVRESIGTSKDQMMTELGKGSPEATPSTHFSELALLLQGRNKRRKIGMQFQQQKGRTRSGLYVRVKFKAVGL